ncbi:tRNA:m(4)X modification enzyme TRM13-like [Oryzias melastigma]|uniref:tRNA:m(4)X modification enzyme TRM13 n=1 Tax=Oryzias melastigma TaxID=30732 RepID=A0A834F5C7_ORYME|nr:tRNA:m(4)X modification enzyme TRM13-like [Oryzias melastigma]
MAAPLPDRCSFFVERKKRFCKMMVRKGQRFCGEHANAAEGGSIRRIVCPLDPKHTVAEDKLEKHLKKCNSRQKPKPVYHVENINAGPEDGDEALPDVSLSERSWSELELLLEKLKKASEGLQCEVEDNFLDHPALQEELANPKNGDSAHKHLKQQVHLDELGLLRRGRCLWSLVPVGGNFSLDPRSVKNNGDLKNSEDLQLLLVERSSIRFKDRTTSDLQSFSEPEATGISLDCCGRLY